MEGASVQPGHHQGRLLQLGVHISGGEPCGPGPDGEPCGAQILSLHRQQSVDPLVLPGLHSRYSDHARDPSQGPTPRCAPARPLRVVGVSTGAPVRLSPPVVYALPFALMWGL